MIWGQVAMVYERQMSIQPFLEASPFVKFHATAALLALLLGSIQLLMQKGGKRHRVVGYIWLASMLIVSSTSFFINHFRLIGPFSPIHILSVLTLINVPRAVLAARSGNIKAHRSAMLQLYWLALVGAGLFTLLPNRIFGYMLFGP